MMIVLWRKKKRELSNDSPWEALPELSCLQLWWQNLHQDHLDHLSRVAERIAEMSSTHIYIIKTASGTFFSNFPKFLLMIKRTGQCKTQTADCIPGVKCRLRL